jgi:laminin alpha 1/2
MDHAEPYPSSDLNQRATAVESCRCPQGYSGSSCESCAPGYKRAQGGSYLGLCEKSNDGKSISEIP